MATDNVERIPGRSGIDIPPQNCDDCNALVIDILSGSTSSSEQWHILRSEQATLSYRNHLDGTVATLQRSSGNGCQICNLILARVHDLDPSKSTTQYYIFVWDKIPERAQFQVAINDINFFTKHVSEWKPLKSLNLFAQLCHASTLPELVVEILPGGNRRPLLSHLPHQDPGSPEAFRRARQWLDDCQSSHGECSRPPSILPKRVLDLGKPGEELNIALYITKGEVRPYAALSYTWGETDRLISKREHELSPTIIIQHRVPMLIPGQAKLGFICVASWSSDHIPLEAFPETLKDGIRIAKELGFQYIWIDSLCILQGDKKDWADQGVAMTDIYGRATLIISATSTQSSDKGILRRLQNDRDGIGTLRHHHASNAPIEIYVGSPMKTLDLEEKFISTRGWVFQERLVSTATLHYTDEGMVWECAHGTFLDHDQNSSSVRWKANWRKVMRQASFNHSNVPFAQALGKKSRNEIWYEWITAYSERNLYDSKDKFPAIAGVAKKFAQVFGMFTEGVEFQQNYVAGLWKDEFVTGLLWRRHNRTKTLIPLRDEYVAPTWSWGSVKGRLEYRSAVLTQSNIKGRSLEVHDYNIIEEFPGSYGQLLPGANILIEGLLQPVIVDRHTHPGVRQKPYQECGISQGFVNSENVLCSLDVYAEDAPRYLECWCLRIGSHDVYGREGDLFLLLEQVPGSASGNEYQRIGFVETDAWWDRMTPTPDSGKLESPRLTALTIY